MFVQKNFFLKNFVHFNKPYSLLKYQFNSKQIKLKHMKEYLLLLRGGKPAASKTEAENKAEMQAWGAYMGGLMQKGQMVGGLPLQSGGAVVSAKGSTSEPVKSSTEGIVGGYLIVKADSLQQATELAKGCPHVDNEGNIEVREIAPMPAM
jgi:hypothetical protein